MYASITQSSAFEPFLTPADVDFRIFSFESQFNEIKIRHHCHSCSMAEHKRPTTISTILVLEDSYLLSPEWLVPHLHGVAGCVPESAMGHGEHTGVGDGMHHGDHFSWRGV